MSSGKSEPGSARAPVDWEALARFLAGASSGEEAEAIRRSLASHPPDHELVASLDAAIQRHAGGRPNVDVESALRRVLARRAEEPTNLPARVARQSVGREAAKWNGPLITALAASTIIVVGLALWRTEGLDRSRPSVTRDARTFVTAIGARDSFALEDGTRVVLGPGSRLEQSADFGGARREVVLNGEAHFDVIHDDRHPFIVRAGAATIHDFGTAFSVRSDDGQEVRVVVTSGTVWLNLTTRPESGGVVLQPGDVGTLQSNGQLFRARAVIDEELAWTQGRLEFREAPLPSVIAALRRWYGVQLVIADTALSRRHLTVSFDGEPLDRVLHVIGLALESTVEQSGDTVMLRSTNRGARPR